ncbi:DUF6776 family protein [Parachitinimonas caeni]|uniref:Uncharacterized protein n=1 Tax=Parachitinimonas caeni TaxID=3031301 RepID=A0ABT7DU47_9NEIS|nr:DUF6776 family protein [Parachitinimonas caeni]MDK2123602.1 hypothetical protein [Parachitinimonas caeni]
MKTHISWPLRIVFALGCALGLFAIGYFLYEFGRQKGTEEVLADQRLRSIQSENELLRRELVDQKGRQAGQAQTLKVELTTRESLIDQLRQSQSENAKLREEVAFYETLLTKTDRSPALSIESFRAEPQGSGYRIRLLLLQGQSSPEPFKGEVEFKLVAKGNGQAHATLWPVGHRLPLDVRRFARIEQEIPALRLQQVEVRIYAAGDSKVRLSRTFDVKG